MVLIPQKPTSCMQPCCMLTLCSRQLSSRATHPIHFEPLLTIHCQAEVAGVGHRCVSACWSNGALPAQASRPCCFTNESCTNETCSSGSHAAHCALAGMSSACRWSGCRCPRSRPGSCTTPSMRTCATPSLTSRLPPPLPSRLSCWRMSQTAAPQLCSGPQKSTWAACTTPTWQSEGAAQPPWGHCPSTSACRWRLDSSKGWRKLSR